MKNVAIYLNVGIITNPLTVFADIFGKLLLKKRSRKNTCINLIWKNILYSKITKILRSTVLTNQYIIQYTKSKSLAKQTTTDDCQNLLIALTTTCTLVDIRQRHNIFCMIASLCILKNITELSLFHDDTMVVQIVVAYTSF